MSEEWELAAIERIRNTFDELVRYGMSPTDVVGAEDSVIDSVAVRQNASGVPVAFREVLRLIGKYSGPFTAAADFGGAGDLYETTKELALEAVDEAPVDQRPLSDPEHMLVISEYLGSAWLVIDGSDLGEVDPTVWSIMESGRIVDKQMTVSGWFAIAAEFVKKEIDRQRS